MPSLPPAIDLVVHRQGDGPPLVALHDLLANAGQDGAASRSRLLLTLGAGDVWKVGMEVLKKL